MSNLAPLVPLSVDEELNPVQRLSDRHQIFVWEYLKSLNASHAAKAAGYSLGTHAQIGWNLLEREDIKAAILFEQTRRLAKHEAAAHRIIGELCGIAFANMHDLYNGTDIPDLSRLTREQWAAIQEVTTEYYTEGKGDDAQQVKRVKIKYHPKTAAIEQLIKMLGLAQPEVFDVRMNGEVKKIERIIVDHLANPDAT